MGSHVNENEQNLLKFKNGTRGPCVLILCLRTNLAIHQSVTLLPFYPGVELSLFSHRSSGFGDMGQFSKLPLLGMKRSKKLHIYVYHLSTPRRAKLSLFSHLVGQRSLRYRPIFKIVIFGHETLSLAKVPEVAHMFSIYPRGSKLSLFSRYSFCSTGSGFRDTGRFSKLPSLGMKLGKWPKFQKLHIYFVPQGAEIELIFTLQAAVFEIRADFQNCHIWA